MPSALQLRQTTDSFLRGSCLVWRCRCKPWPLVVCATARVGRAGNSGSLRESIVRTKKDKTKANRSQRLGRDFSFKSSFIQTFFYFVANHLSFYYELSEDAVHWSTASIRALSFGQWKCWAVGCDQWSQISNRWSAIDRDIDTYRLHISAALLHECLILKNL